jgi:hypothetical protein
LRDKLEEYIWLCILDYVLNSLRVLPVSQNVHLLCRQKPL